MMSYTRFRYGGIRRLSVCVRSLRRWRLSSSTTMPERAAVLSLTCSSVAFRLGDPFSLGSRLGALRIYVPGHDETVDLVMLAIGITPVGDV